MEQMMLNIILFLIIDLAAICLYLFVTEIINVVRFNRRLDKGKSEIDHIVHQIKATR